jgi:hypothetical protein
LATSGNVTEHAGCICSNGRSKNNDSIKVARINKSDEGMENFKRGWGLAREFLNEVMSIKYRKTL